MATATATPTTTTRGATTKTTTFTRTATTTTTTRRTSDEGDDDDDDDDDDDEALVSPRPSSFRVEFSLGCLPQIVGMPHSRRIPDTRPQSSKRTPATPRKRKPDKRASYKKRPQTRAAAAAAREFSVRLQSLIALVRSVMSDDWDSAWLSRMSLRTPWAVMSDALAEHFHDVHSGVWRPDHAWMLDLDAVVRAKGPKEAFRTLAVDVRAEYVRVAVAELCALGLFRHAQMADNWCCDEIWRSMELDDKAAWAPHPEMLQEVIQCCST